MKNLFFISAIILSTVSFAQEEPKTPEVPVVPEPKKSTDTTRINLKNMQVIVVSKDDGQVEIEIDTIDAAPIKPKGNVKGHWAGLDFGFNVLTDGSGSTRFPNYKYWQNDPVNSTYFNLNIGEKKFKLVQEYVGLTTGVGFNWNQVAFTNNYILMDSIDTIVGVISPQYYSKNELRATYLQVPLLLEFNTNRDNEKGLYVAVGVIGGVKLSSKVKREGKIEGDKFKEKIKGTYALNPFKCDLTARFGYGYFGAFVNYSLMPLFDTEKTTEVYPLSFGVSLNF